MVRSIKISLTQNYLLLTPNNLRLKQNEYACSEESYEDL